MKKLLLALTMLLLTTTLFAKTEAILKIDPKGHTGMIKDIVVDNNGNIISASADKTIRVWGSDGVEKRKILGQIGVGSEGSIYAIALSSDNRYLAVGGFLDKLKNLGTLKRKEKIKIYDYKTGKLLQLINAHKASIDDLAFSKDNHYLISGSHDKTAKIWDVKDSFSLKNTIKFHTNHVYGVGIIKTKNNYFAVTASYDNKIALYDMRKKKIVNSHTLNYKLSFLAINNKHIAVCGKGKEIKIYNYKLELLKTIKSETKPVGLAYSPKGNYLIAGSLSDYNYEIVNIYSTKSYLLLNSFKKHTNLTKAVNFLNNTTAISGGGNNNEIYIWNLKTTKVKQKIEGVGSKVWSVGINGDSVAWGNTWTKAKGKSKLQKSINLKTFKIDTDTKKLKNFKRISSTNGRYTLSHTKGGDYGYDDGVLLIKKDETTLSKIVKTSTNGLGHNCYGWYKEYIISGGSNGDLKIYNKQGKEVASLVGHTGAIWSIALDGDRLVSGSSDQSIKVWDLSKVGYSKTIYPMLNIFTTKNNDYIVWSKSGYFTSSAGGDKYVGYHINQGANKEARYVGSDKYFDTLYRPDIIEAIWQTGSEKKAIAYVSRTRKVKSVDIATSLPPVVTLLSSSNITTTKKTVTIKFSVDSEVKVKEIIILHNGERIKSRGIKRKKSKDSKSITIELESGKNIISIKARNKFAVSDEALVYVTRKSKKSNIYKPTLYLLSIGVSEYENSEYNLGVADKDALSITKMFKKQEGKIYKKVVTKTLTNKDAVSDNILDALDWVDRESTSKDVVIIFIAGHGVNDEKGNYYFLSHDANLDRLRRTAIKWNELEDTMKNLPSKVILLADTCHSGDITGNRRDITGAIKSIMNSGTGSIIMTATTGSGYSYEDAKWGHGAFTKSFLDGVGKMRADYDKDNVITIKEIDLYITSNVKKLTDGKQKPTTIIPNSIPDFAIGVK